MALIPRRYGNMMSKYYKSFIVLLAFAISVVVVSCYLIGVKQFDGEKIYSTNSSANHSLAGKEMLTSDTKCANLYEIAKDMLLNGDRVALPYETDNTRWTFHRTGDLDYLKQIHNQWQRYKAVNFSSFVNIKSKDIKAKKYFITFAHGCCKDSMAKAIAAARDPGGFDVITAHDMNSLSEKFRSTHSAILNKRRGGGFWLWKPYIILKTLIESMSDNDLLMYQDADAYIRRDAGPFLKMTQDLEPGIVVFFTNALQKTFTNRDAYIIMGMDDERVYDSNQRMGAVVLLRKNCQSLQFIMEWLAYTMDPRILIGNGNQMGKPNLPDYKHHNHDQAVISLLCTKWKLGQFKNGFDLIRHTAIKT